MREEGRAARGGIRRVNDNAAVTRNETERKCMRRDLQRPCYRRVAVIALKLHLARPGRDGAAGKCALSSRITAPGLVNCNVVSLRGATHDPVTNSRFVAAH